MATIKLTGFNTSTGRQSVAGDSDVVDLDGSLTIGNADTDAVVFNAEIDSDFVPDDDNTYDLGSMSKVWANTYSTNIFVQTLNINQAFTFPTTDGSANQILKTDGLGNLTWQNESGGGGGSPAGSDEQIQFNNQGSFGASSNFTFNSTANQVELVGISKQCDTNFSSSSEKLRSFTFRKHFNFSSIPANTWTTVLSFRPYKSGTTTDPEANTFWTGVGFKMEITGHTNGTGNGYRSRTGFVSYVGSSATSANASDTTLGSPISTDINLSGWVATLRINPNQANASGFSGTVYIEIYFPRGAGGNGNNIEWSIS